MSFFVAGQSERGGLVSLEVVAAVAGVGVGCRGELTGVLVAMAVGATLKLDFE